MRSIEVNLFDKNHYGFRLVAARFNEYTNRYWVNPNLLEVVNAVPGEVYGPGFVHLSDEKYYGKRILTHLSGDEAYKAIVRFPEGNRCTVFILKETGNFLTRWGLAEKFGRGMRFETKTADVLEFPRLKVS